MKYDYEKDPWFVVIMVLSILVLCGQRKLKQMLANGS